MGHSVAWDYSVDMVCTVVAMATIMEAVMVDIILLMAISMEDMVTLKVILSHTRNIKLMDNLKPTISLKHMLNLKHINRQPIVSLQPIVSIQPIVSLQPILNFQPMVNLQPIVNPNLIPNHRPILKLMHL